MMSDRGFKAYLEGSGYSNVRKLPDGWAGVTRQIFNWALCVELDMSGYARRYDYDDLQKCLIELGMMSSVHDVPEGWARRVPEPFFFTIVGRGDHLHIGALMTEREIVTAAVMSAEGAKPYHLLDVTPSVDEALKRLNGEGRVFEIFDTGTEWRAFLVRAETLGLQDEASKLVESLGARR